MKELLLWNIFTGVAAAFVVNPSKSFSDCHHHVLASRLYNVNDRMAEQMGVPDYHSDEEWHPRDPASSTPQLLAGLWNQICQVGSMEKGETYTVIYPAMEHEFTPAYLSRLMGHLDNCKDVCDHFGIRTNIVPYLDKAKIVGFTAKSYRGPESDDEEMQFDYDPFWDEDDIGDYTGVDDEVEGVFQDKYPAIVNKIPDDDDEIISITKNWVSKMMSDMGVCPFTSGAEQAGLPMGQIYYTVDRCSGMEEMYLTYWKEVVRVELKGERELSTTLLITPEFLMDNIDLFETYTNTLTQPLAALGIEDLAQLVFFHPLWTFRDGGDRFGDGMAANYARRSPWPMINILRTKQVRAAQKGIPTGLVYTQNEKTLTKIGVDKLETMLRLRDWKPIADEKVNRRDMEALRVAQDYQQTGVIQSQDLKFEGDATPAANKVDQQQLEQSNLVNVIKQALGKRLGLDSDIDEGSVTRLTGPETSATIMASDFLLAELKKIEEQQRAKPVSAAHQMLMDDIMGGEEAVQRDESEVLFGGGGIPMRNADDEPQRPPDNLFL